MMQRLGFGGVLLLSVAMLLPISEAKALTWPSLTTPKEDPEWCIGVRFGPYRPRISAQDDQYRRFFDLQFADGLRGSNSS